MASSPRGRKPAARARSAPDAGPDWEAVQSGPEFARLRHAVRRFIFPTTIAFLSWYLLYVLLVAYARPFMNTKVFGNVNVGLIFGLLQFVSTFAIAVLYSRYANRKMDPLSDALRAEIEGSTK